VRDIARTLKGRLRRAGNSKKVGEHMGKRLFVVASLLALVATLQTDADAAQVNSSGAIFQPEIHEEAAYPGGYGVNWSSSVAGMVAAIPRSPGGGAVTVYVDGMGAAGTYSCTVTSIGFAAKSFTVTSAGAWRRHVNFTAAEAPDSAYFAIYCGVPGDGGFKGVTITG